ncbi:hypothetical protein CTEN210_14071 [Chaetoceros tenuissimus]|uniref:Uncharacterized protein n=1 Tax=Chaetoceros tenuissimus TaxID=426638 RepID=A0AAD3D6T3_9STRA|nr:hypothetical protein CTEN210_14071 [Chaetoceros tenuissimus]
MLVTKDRDINSNKANITSLQFHPNTEALQSYRKTQKSIKSHQQLATSSIDGQVIVSNWDRGEERSRVLRFRGNKGGINQIAYSNNGSLIAAASHDHTVRLWTPYAKATDVSDALNLRGHTKEVRGVQFSPHQKSLLVSCSNDKSLRLWNLAKQKCGHFEKTLVGHSNWVNTCKFHPKESELVASGSDDGTLRIWDIVKGENTTIYHTGSYGINEIDIHPDGNIIAATLNGAVQIFDLRSDKVVQSYGEHFFKGISYHKSSGQLLIGSIDTSHNHTFSLYDNRIHNALFTVHHSNEANHDTGSCRNLLCCFSDDGKQFATSSSKYVTVWNIEGTFKATIHDGNRKDHCQIEKVNSREMRQNLEELSQGTEKEEQTTKSGISAISEVKVECFECSNGVNNTNSTKEMNIEAFNRMFHLLDSLTKSVVKLEKRVQCLEEKVGQI